MVFVSIPCHFVLIVQHAGSERLESKHDTRIRF
jgi:hypothetical protein